MRRIAVMATAALVAAGALAGCGSSAPAGTANTAVTASGSFGQQPKVTIPAEKAGAQLSVKTVIHGHGAVLTSSDALLGNISIYRWRGTSHQLLESTFVKGGPQLLPPDIELKGLEKALVGQHIGSRVLAVLPPKYGYGSQGNSEIHIEPSDTTVWVIDMIRLFQPGTAASGQHVSSGGGSGLPTVGVTAGGVPTVKIGKAAPPAKLITKTLIQGSGAALVKGDNVIAQVVGVNYRTGKTFYSTWPSASTPSGAPFSFQLGGQVISGWNMALPGVKVGSRIMLIVPPADGYGKTGNSSAGIKGTDDLVFVIDILDGVATPAS